MILKNKWFKILLTGLLVVLLGIGITTTFTALAQTNEGNGDETQETPEESEPESGTDEAVPLPGFAFGWHRDNVRGDGQALADALGITLEELQAAYEEAAEAALAQAVADGLLTQEQADELLARAMPGRRFNLMGAGETFLAEALGITVEALRAAKLQVYAERLAELVDAGMITQEQADRAVARRAVQGYIEETAVQEALRALYEEAVNQALADGVITQEQADDLLSSEMTFGRGFSFSFGGGRGPRMHMRHFGPRGLGPGELDAESFGPGFGAGGMGMEWFDLGSGPGFEMELLPPLPFLEDIDV